MDWTLKFTDLAIVFATLAGPFIGIAAQRFVDERRQKHRNRLRVFSVLMSTRAQLLSQAHVNALNAIPLEFHGDAKGLREIRIAFKVYLEHLSAGDSTSAPWHQRRADLLIDLLRKMGAFLKYEFDPVELNREFYAPTGHATIESEQETVRRGLADLFSGNKPLPLAIRSIDQDAEAAARTAALQDALLKWMRGDAIPIVRVADKDEPVTRIARGLRDHIP